MGGQTTVRTYRQTLSMSIHTKKTRYILTYRVTSIWCQTTCTESGILAVFCAQQNTVACLDIELFFCVRVRSVGGV